LLDYAVPTVRLTLRQVFDEHAAYVGRTLRYLGVGEAEIADGVQETFLVVDAQLASFEGRSSMRTWLRQICVRIAMSQRRKHARRRETALDPDAPGAPVDAGPAPRQETRELLQRLLDKLDDDQRAVFVLYEVEEMSMREVAEAVGCPLQTAYSRYQAARATVARHAARLGARRDR
jgi:RNA polymerase sigma-70 factor (ECF subfamily)